MTKNCFHSPMTKLLINNYVDIEKLEKVYINCTLNFAFVSAYILEDHTSHFNFKLASDVLKNENLTSAVVVYIVAQFMPAPYSPLTPPQTLNKYPILSHNSHNTRCMK